MAEIVSTETLVVTRKRAVTQLNIHLPADSTNMRADVRFETVTTAPDGSIIGVGETEIISFSADELDSHPDFATWYSGIRDHIHKLRKDRRDKEAKAKSKG